MTVTTASAVKIDTTTTVVCWLPLLGSGVGGSTAEMQVFVST